MYIYIYISIFIRLCFDYNLSSFKILDDFISIYTEHVYIYIYITYRFLYDYALTTALHYVRF